MSSSTFIILLLATFMGSVFCGGCPVPSCEESTANQTDESLHAHTNPNKFWQCAPSSERPLWKPVEKDCAPGGTYFSVDSQRCVWLHEWNQTCQHGSGSTTTEQPWTSTPITEPSTTATTVAPAACCSPLDCSVAEVALLPECPSKYQNYREYYRECVNGREVSKHCPHKPGAEQLVFNYYIQSCVHPLKFEEGCY